MDQYFQQHKSFVASAAYLVLGLLLFGFSYAYSPAQVAALDAQVLSGILQKEATELTERRKQLDQKKAEESQDASSAINSLPKFLTHINSIAQDTKVIIDELMPSKDTKLKFTLKIRADYLTFLRFAARLETLNVSINDQQVRPFNAGVTPPIHAIEFSITPRNDAEPLSGTRLTQMQTQVNEPNKRNPFQRFAFNGPNKEVTKQIELTWIYKLTGIGSANGKRTATINGRDYAIGDDMEGMAIAVIESDRVLLKKENADGVTEYILKRRTSGVAKSAP